MTDFLNELVTCFTTIAPYAVLWAISRKLFVYTVQTVTGNNAEF